MSQTSSYPWNKPLPREAAHWQLRRRPPGQTPTRWELEQKPRRDYSSAARRVLKRQHNRRARRFHVQDDES